MENTNEHRVKVANYVLYIFHNLRASLCPECLRGNKNTKEHRVKVVSYILISFIISVHLYALSASVVIRTLRSTELK
jgi:hypothetical protein